MDLKQFIRNEEIIEIAKSLVEIESHKHCTTKELNIVTWIKNFLDKEGIETSIDEVEKDRPNICGKIKGENDETALMLSGHIDTIPGFNMDYEPFQPFTRNGKLYGRGACDMKGGIAAMLAAITAVKRANIKLSHSVMFAGVIDEEEQSKGTEHLIKNNIQARMAIIGEPTQLNVSVVHKGMEWIEVIFKGRATHGSRPRDGINAIYAAAEFIKLVHDELEPIIESKQFHLLGNGTINVGVIQGGEDPNIVPDHCVVKIDRRWLPSEKIENIHNEVEVLAKRASDRIGSTFQIRGMREATASMLNTPHHVDIHSPLVQEALKIVSEVKGTKQEATAFPAWSDAALLSNHMGMECIVLGPGNINQAHSNDEFCDIEEIIKAAHIYMELIKKFCIKEKVL